MWQGAAEPRTQGHPGSLWGLPRPALAPGPQFPLCTMRQLTSQLPVPLRSGPRAPCAAEEPWPARVGGAEPARPPPASAANSARGCRGGWLGPPASRPRKAGGKGQAAGAEAPRDCRYEVRQLWCEWCRLGRTEALTPGAQAVTCLGDRGRASSKGDPGRMRHRGGS